MPIPEVSRDDVLAAIRSFDATLRRTKDWRDWEDRGVLEFAVEFEDKRYPVKEIVRDAAGVSPDSFRVDEANRWLRQRGFKVISLRSGRALPNWWWANQKDSYDDELTGGYLWAPKRDRQGAPPGSNNSLLSLAVGDRVLHYADGAIRAVGIVRRPAFLSPRPGTSSKQRQEANGYRIQLEHFPLTSAIRLSNIPSALRTVVGSPFDRNNNVKPGFVLPLSVDFVTGLAEHFAAQLPEEAYDWAMMRQTRDSEKISNVRDAVQRMYPDIVGRRLALSLLGGTIERAHEVAPSGWCTRLIAGDSLRLYVASEKVCELRKDELYLALNLDDLEPTVRMQLDEQAVSNSSEGPLLTKPAVEGARLPARRLANLLPLVKGPHLSFVEHSAQQARTRTSHYMEHQSEIVQYLSQELGRNLPQPNYDEKPEQPAVGYQEPSFKAIVTAVANQGMRLDPRTLRRYHLALKTRGFVVLSGLSGTGKTWLAEAYARAVGARHAVVAVAPNWTTNEDLLGYHNPLTAAYHHTAFSTFVSEAAREYQRASDAGETPRPFHLVLDEMNLARVEYYFAQFLSAMEVRARHGSASMTLGGGEQLLLPPNLYVIGTVNVDETTHGFADKVYDRAQLIELGMSREALQAHLGETLYADAVMEVWDAVRHVGPFTFRILDEVRNYVSAAETMGTTWEHALDEQILQKVLPKLKGADPRVGVALEQVVEKTRVRFPLSHAKAARMLEDFRSHGFASYFG